jgi:hypothetical protein
MSAGAALTRAACRDVSRGGVEASGSSGCQRGGIAPGVQRQRPATEQAACRDVSGVGWRARCPALATGDGAAGLCSCQPGGIARGASKYQRPATERAAYPDVSGVGWRARCPGMCVVGLRGGVSGCQRDAFDPSGSSGVSVGWGWPRGVQLSAEGGVFEGDRMSAWWGLKRVVSSCLRRATAQAACAEVYVVRFARRCPAACVVRLAQAACLDVRVMVDPSGVQMSACEAVRAMRGRGVVRDVPKSAEGVMLDPGGGRAMSWSRVWVARPYHVRYVTSDAAPRRP